MDLIKKENKSKTSNTNWLFAFWYKIIIQSHMIVHWCLLTPYRSRIYNTQAHTLSLSTHPDARTLTHFQYSITMFNRLIYHYCIWYVVLSSNLTSLVQIPTLHCLAWAHLPVLHGQSHISIAEWGLDITEYSMSAHAPSTHAQALHFPRRAQTHSGISSIL